MPRARIRVPDFQFFVVSLLLQRQTGGGLAETLSNLSAIIRPRKALRLKARALAAEAKLLQRSWRPRRSSSGSVSS